MPGPVPDTSPPAPSPAGTLDASAIEALVAAGVVRSAAPPAEGQVQPASLDLRLGPVAWRLRASFLPNGLPVAERLRALALHRIDLTAGAVLEAGCVYLVELQESLALPPDLAASANPKSSTGRLDVFTRVVTDRARAFDQVPAGYRGPLFAEVVPRTFPVLAREGSRLSQLRFRRGDPRLTDAETAALHAGQRLTDDASASIAGGIAVSVDLAGAPGALIGWRARRHAGLVDLDAIGAHAAGDYWEPLIARGAPEIVLDPGQFYILASREAVHVPPAFAAEMTPFDPLVGEFRVHYAGFFDPGFGHAPAGGGGSRAVLEVRSHDVPFILEHGQVVGRLVYERMARVPARLYGQGLGSSYQAQGLKLSKHFRD